MANKTATVRLNLTYVGPSDESITAPVSQLSLAYQAQSEGTIDVPDATTSATSYTIPLGSIELPVFVLVGNRTGQPLTLNVAGDDYEDIPDGGFAVLLGAAAAIATALVVKTTALQAGAGLISYRIFGDPV